MHVFPWYLLSISKTQTKLVYNQIVMNKVNVFLLTSRAGLLVLLVDLLQRSVAIVDETSIEELSWF